MPERTLIGADTEVDRLIREYFPGVPESNLYELFESEQAMLLAALLKELRGDRTEDTTTEAEAVYTSKSEVVVDSASEDSVSWGYPAGTVVVWGFDAPVTVAFKGQNKADREIPLTASEAPFSLSPQGGLGADTLWYSKQTAGAADTTLNVLALQ